MICARGGVVTLGGGVPIHVSALVAASSADAITWAWAGDPVTSWRIKWGTWPGDYRNTHDIADANARAVMLSAFLTGSGTYYVVVVAVDAGGEGTQTDELAISYTA